MPWQDDISQTVENIPTLCNLYHMSLELLGMCVPPVILGLFEQSLPCTKAENT